MELRHIVLAVLTTWVIIFSSSVLLHGNILSILEAPPPPPPKRIFKTTITKVSIEDPKLLGDLEVEEDVATHEGEL